MKLVARQGPVAGAEFALDKPVLIIGRGAEADIALPDEKSSRRHAELRLAGDQLSITDLNSANGTFVNGVRIYGSRALRLGDEIRIGHVVLSLQEGLAHAGQPLPVPLPGDQEPLPVSAPHSSRLKWVLAGVGMLAALAVLGLGGWLIWRTAWPGETQAVAGHQTATAQVVPGVTGATHTPTRPAAVVTPAASQTPTPGKAISPTATLRATVTGIAAGSSPQPGTPPPQPAPFTVSWTRGRYEGWAEGRRMSSDLTIENISLPPISPPYQPYFIISDANGVMRVGELHDYSSPTNPLPALAPGQRVTWTWFTIMSNQEWVRGSVFRHGGWSWAQEFNPDGSLNGPPRAISDQQLIPFLPVQIPPEQLATVFPTLAPSFVPTR